ncbi:MAG: PHP domain-containing protein, partial [Betaproteobacteria bacterium]|nr:PHP domain-containing protein [Betaproteobacteria bacterium]
MDFSPDLLPRYAELHCLSNFSFLRGASHPEELVERAKALGYEALAITDECSLAGVARAHVAAKECNLKLIIGTEITLADAMKIVLLAKDRASYGAISSLITTGRRRSRKGTYSLSREDLEPRAAESVLMLWIPGTLEQGLWIRERFPEAWIGAELHLGANDRRRLEELKALSKNTGLPLVASGDVHMHVRSRRKLQDILTATRIGKPLAACGQALFPNAERHLRLRMRLAQLYPRPMLEESAKIAGRCAFSLDTLKYEYPEELVPPGETPASHLRKLTEAGLRWRFPQGAPEKVRSLVEHELLLIKDLEYEPFFLTVNDAVQFARS